MKSVSKVLFTIDKVKQRYYDEINANEYAK